MPHLYIEEDNTSGDIIVCDKTGDEVIRFQGQEALNHALHWAKTQGLQVYSNFDPDELHERHRPFFRRGLRLFRVRRSRNTPAPSQADPPNVQRIIVPEFDDFYDEDIEPPYPVPMPEPEDQPWTETIELAPDTDTTDDEAGNS